MQYLYIGHVAAIYRTHPIYISNHTHIYILKVMVELRIGSCSINYSYFTFTSDTQTQNDSVSSLSYRNTLSEAATKPANQQQ